ncbi:MAG: hypothetical protein JWO58_150 [Chitinophagaceae bacterium]|nr:hypothetical protein [Chitinophagaceae bacterium]
MNYEMEVKCQKCKRHLFSIIRISGVIEFRCTECKESGMLVSHNLDNKIVTFGKNLSVRLRYWKIRLVGKHNRLSE